MARFGQSLVLFIGLVVVMLLPSISRAQVVNGDFSAGATGWTSTAPFNSTIVFSGGQVTTTSNDNSAGNVATTVTQSFTAADPGYLSYLLVSYTSTDVPDFDFPIVVVDGTNFRVGLDGSLVTGLPAVNNGAAATNVSGSTALAAGLHTIGVGVVSTDSILGPGIAIWDDVEFQEITQSPVAQTTLENNALILSGTNAPQTATNTTDTITVTLSVTSGIISLGSPSSVTITGGADGSSSVTFTGSPADINTAMDGLIYTPNINFTGADTLVYAASGGAISDTDNIPINVIAGTRNLSVTKEADVVTNVVVGQTITYTYRVTNTGDQVMSNITLSDVHNGSGTPPVPTGEVLTNDSLPAGDSSDGGVNESWDILAPGDEVTFTGTYVVTQSDVDTLQ